MTDSEPEPSAPASTVDTPINHNEESYPASNDSQEEVDEEAQREGAEDGDVTMEVCTRGTFSTIILVLWC